MLRKLLEESPQEFKEASEEVIIGIPEYEKKFISEYRLPNDSIALLLLEKVVNFGQENVNLECWK